jgi:aldehyde:ferredoxin oxidoreductase
MGKILRVDLTEKKAWKEELDEATYKKYVGGVALGAKCLYEEVPPGVYRRASCGKSYKT